jgi:hypothetical protein
MHIPTFFCCVASPPPWHSHLILLTTSSPAVQRREKRIDELTSVENLQAKLIEFEALLEASKKKNGELREALVHKEEKSSSAMMQKVYNSVLLPILSRAVPNEDLKIVPPVNTVQFGIRLQVSLHLVLPFVF